MLWLHTCLRVGIPACVAAANGSTAWCVHLSMSLHEGNARSFGFWLRSVMSAGLGLPESAHLSLNRHAIGVTPHYHCLGQSRIHCASGAIFQKKKKNCSLNTLLRSAHAHRLMMMTTSRSFRNFPHCLLQTH